MDNINTILFFLQTLHYRDDLENFLFKNLLNSTDYLSVTDIEHLYEQKAHPELVKNTEVILTKFGVLKQVGQRYQLDKNRLNQFIEMVNLAKAARNYKWPMQKHNPLLYVSPPNLITSDLSGDVDDISNLLINLVRSAMSNISIMSPFTNKEGLRSILSPLKSCRNNLKISIYLVVNEQDEAMIYNQIKLMIPTNMKLSLKVYFCSPSKVDDDSLPHAKLLTIDSVRGYLGSANFTSQGLTSRFELGVELNEQQSKTTEKLLKMLVEKGLFVLYDNSTGNWK